MDELCEILSEILDGMLGSAAPHEYKKRAKMSDDGDSALH